MGREMNVVIVPPWIVKTVAYLTLFAFLAAIYAMLFWLVRVTGVI